MLIRIINILQTTTQPQTGKMAPDLTKSGSNGNAQNNRVGKNGPKYQLLKPDDLVFSIWEENAKSCSVMLFLPQQNAT